jgi:hypothetical protein
MSSMDAAHEVHLLEHAILGVACSIAPESDRFAVSEEAATCHSLSPSTTTSELASSTELWRLTCYIDVQAPAYLFWNSANYIRMTSVALCHQVPHGLFKVCHSRRLINRKIRGFCTVKRSYRAIHNLSDCAPNVQHMTELSQGELSQLCQASHIAMATLFTSQTLKRSIRYPDTPFSSSTIVTCL